MAYKNVTHVIFDLDGLLLATEEAYQNAIQDVVRRFGKEYTQNVRMKVLGTTESDTAKIVISELSIPLSPEEFHKQYFNIAQIGLAKAVLFPGAEKLMRHLTKHKIPIAMATSSSKESVVIKSQNHLELFSLFHHQVMASSDPEVKRGKPFPDIFLTCAARFEDGVKPEDILAGEICSYWFSGDEPIIMTEKSILKMANATLPKRRNDPIGDNSTTRFITREPCLVFEDAPNGVTAAIGAGMQVVMVPESETDPRLCTAATLVLKSLEDFKPELFGLPPF